MGTQVNKFEQIFGLAHQMQPIRGLNVQLWTGVKPWQSYVTSREEDPQARPGGPCTRGLGPRVGNGLMEPHQCWHLVATCEVQYTMVTWLILDGDASFTYALWSWKYYLPATLLGSGYNALQLTWMEIRMENHSVKNPQNIIAQCILNF